MVEMRHGEIFKVRNPIRSFLDKRVAILYNAVIIRFEIKGSEMNKGGEYVYDIFFKFVNVKRSL
jgi:hypothetical protein